MTMSQTNPTRRTILSAVALAAPAFALAATMPIKAVVFDALGTLFDTAAISAEAVRLFGPRGEALSQVWRLKQLEYTWLATAAQADTPLSVLSRQALDYAAAQAGVTMTPDQVAALLAGYSRLPAFSDVKPGLAALKPVRLAVLSASGPGLLKSLVEANGLAIPTLISTEGLGVFKPAPQAYALAAQTLALAPGEILLVSSNSFDVWGAGRFGFRTAWVQRPSAAGLDMYSQLRSGREALQPGPDHVIASMAELAALVQPSA